MRSWKVPIVAAAIALFGAAAANADSFSGDLYYTNFNGGENVNRVHYSYNDSTVTFGLSGQTGLAALNGADGIIFDAHGNLLVGGQGSGFVYQLKPDGTFIAQGAVPGGASFHLALDPSGNSVYTSNFGGPLETMPLTGAGNTIQAGTQHAVTGDDTGITQLAFAPTTGNWFYVDGAPNGGGNLGLFNLATDQTTRQHAGVNPAHGLIFDSYTGLMTIFGRGFTGTFDQSGNNLLTSSTQFTSDFDQGAVDGLGHALVAGNGQITFLDYRQSHDITHPDHVFVVGGFSGIDDVAPLSGLGSSTPTVPEPASLTLLGLGLAGALRRKIVGRRA